MPSRRERNIIGDFRCSKCNEWKPPSSFNRRANTINGRQSMCKICASQHSLAYRQRIGPVQSSDQRRLKVIRAEFLSAQGDACAVCGTTEPGGTGWCLDHDHACCDTTAPRACGSCYRGVLCPPCNARVIPVAESPLLDAALRYLGKAA